MNFIKWLKEWSRRNRTGSYVYVLVSHPPPTRFFETQFTGHILLILHSVHVNAADLHVHLKDVSLPKIPGRLPPDFFYRERGVTSPGANLSFAWRIMV